MKINDALTNVDSLKNACVNVCETVPPFAVVLTGSIAREDAAVDFNGNLLSGMDMLVVVNSAENKLAIDFLLKRSIFKQFKNTNCSLSLIYTLKPNLQYRKHSLFVQSININNVIFDNIGLTKYLKNLVTSDSQLRTSEIIIEYFQSEFYYQAKYKNNPSLRTALKVNELIKCISIYFNESNYNGYQYTLNDRSLFKSVQKSTLDQFGLLPQMKVVLKRILSLNVTLLSSSLYFLKHKALSPHILYSNMRGIVFLENWT